MRQLFWRTIAFVTTSVLFLAACAPAPPPPETEPVQPVITSFIATSPRKEAPVLATLGWRISDANNDKLTCRVDTNGDGDFDRTITGCNSSNLVLGEFPNEGDYTLALEVSDGNTAPVTATTQLAVAAGPTESYKIDLRFDGVIRAEFRDAFEAAALRWASVIVADAPDEYLDIPWNPFGFPPYQGPVDDLLIDVRIVPMDGPGKVLGRAAPVAIRSGSGQPYYGFMEFDLDDMEMLLDSGDLPTVVLHEMGHLLGLGPVWLLDGLIIDVFNQPRYTGRAANAAYQQLGGKGLIPVEDEGAWGTVLGHWKESVFDDELMTGYLNGQTEALSIVTVGALADRGYGVDMSAADPYTLPEFRTAVAGRRAEAARGGMRLDFQASELPWVSESLWTPEALWTSDAL